MNWLTRLLVLFAAVSVYCGPTPGINTTEAGVTPEPTPDYSSTTGFETLKHTSPSFNTVEDSKATATTTVGNILEVTLDSIDYDDDFIWSAPLFLTPLIEAGNISLAQRAADVYFTYNLNITSYAGFFTVNKTYNSNHFFWYFPPTNADATTAPVILWLQGGLGASSLYGLWKENGPLIYAEDGLEIREHHWAKDHHMLYIDNPVGAGFSFTENESGYCTNEVQVGDDLYSSVTQFLQLFPELQHNEFYIAGESYAGKYIPALAYTIHKKNQDAELKVNLRGMAIGNGLCDPEHQIGYSEHAYQAGLIDWRNKEEAEQMEKDAVRFIKEKNWEDASFMYDNARYYGSTGLSHFNYVGNPPPPYLTADKPPISDGSFRRGIHVRRRPFSSNNRTMIEKLAEDRMQSVAPWISELLNHYRILFYNGQFDLVVPYPVTVNFLRNLEFSSAEDYKFAERRIWKVDDEVAGYYKTAGNLTEVLVRNSGHMVVVDQPKWALRLIQILTRRRDASTGEMMSFEIDYPKLNGTYFKDYDI